MTTMSVGVGADQRLRELHAAFSDAQPLLLHWLTASADERERAADLLRDRLRGIEVLSYEARRTL
jgi:hypothetical protein